MNNLQREGRLTQRSVSHVFKGDVGVKRRLMVEGSSKFADRRSLTAEKRSDEGCKRIIRVRM